MPRKRTEPPREQRSPDPSAPETDGQSQGSADRHLDLALATMGRGVSTIDAAITAAAKVVEDGIKAGPHGYDKDAASHLAWLTKQAAQIAAVIRQCAAHDQKQLAKITLAHVLEWYKRLSEDERADLQRRIAAIDDGRSILAL